MTAEEFLKLLETSTHKVELVEFDPPSTGKSGFGEFKVKFKTPYY